MNRPFHTRETVDWWVEMHRHLGDGARLNRDEVELGWNKYRWGDPPANAARAIRASRSPARQRAVSALPSPA